MRGWVIAARYALAAVLLAAEAVRRKRHRPLRWFLAQGCWSLAPLGLVAAGIILSLTPAPALLAVDDILARRKGLQVCAAWHRTMPPLASTLQKALVNWISSS